MSKLTAKLTYANVTATLALVFSMTGGALAASHYLITSEKQINPKVLKALKGAKGADGGAGRRLGRRAGWERPEQPVRKEDGERKG